MQRIFVAGTTEYLGRHICAQYQRRGWYVTALVRKSSNTGRLAADQLVEARATEPATLKGVMTEADLVVSCLGMTRQADGISYWDLDYQANTNLLREAEQAGVGRFAYIHVLRAAEMADVPLVAAKSAFVTKLQNSAVAAQLAWRYVRGPDVFTQKQLAKLAFACLEKPCRIVFLPDIFRRIARHLPPLMALRHIRRPARFFLSTIAIDMVREAQGKHHLKDLFYGSFAPRNAATLLHLPTERKRQ